MLRSLVVVAGVAGLMAFAPVPGEAQTLFGPELAWSDEVDLGVGAGVEVAAPGWPGALMGDVIVFFPDGDGDYLEFNGNATFDFPIDGSVLPFALAGVNIGRVSSGDSSNTEVNLNLGGGLKFDAGSFRPRVTARAVLGDFDQLIITAFLPLFGN